MSYWFSSMNNAFYPVALEEDYINAGSLPDNLIEIADSIYNEYSGLPPAGKIRGVGDDGMPLWVDIPPLHHDDIVTNAENLKQMLINSALQSINVIQLKLQSGRLLTEIEKTKLDAVLDYIDALESVDTSVTLGINWPTQPR